MCEMCGGVGFYYSDVPLSHPDFGKALACACQAEKRKALTQRRLQALDGLTALERRHTFDNTYPSEAQAQATRILRDAEAGLFVLLGNPGAGKSHLMHCVVNQAREQGRVAVYTTMTDILDFLRAGYESKGDDAFDERWRLLKECEVLAIDELDEFHVTGWAVERFLRLIDERWRKREETLTLFALNSKLDEFVPKVASRLRQARPLLLESEDMRRVFEQPEYA